MKVALVHDSLTEFGGAERILQILLDLFPDADIFTAFTRNDFPEKYLSKQQQKRIHTSWLQPFPIEHHTSFIQAIAPLVWRWFRLDKYDLVISHGSHIMSNLISVSRNRHITYISSVPKNIIGLVLPTPLQQHTRYDTYIRPFYQKSLQHTTNIIVNSKHTQSVLKHRLGVSSSVIYPPVRIPTRIPTKKPGEYFLCVSRIEPNKHLEIAIEAANILHIHLKIIGVSNTLWYEQKLRSLAGPTIEFLGFCTDAEILALYQKSIAFIFPSKQEDFGIAPLEATAAGVPVIAYDGGGAKETIVEGVTGIFFHTHTGKSLAHAMKRIQQMKFSSETLYAHAKTFSETRFRNEIMDYVVSHTPLTVPNKV